MHSGLFHPYHLEESISNFRGVWCTFHFISNRNPCKQTGYGAPFWEARKNKWVARPVNQCSWDCFSIYSSSLSSEINGERSPRDEGRYTKTLFLIKRGCPTCSLWGSFVYALDFHGIFKFQFIWFFKTLDCVIIKQFADKTICRWNYFYLSHVMRKPVWTICEHQRRRSARASAQSDQRLYLSLLR